MSGEDTISVFHGSINDSAHIKANGLDPNRGTAFVSRNADAANDAIGPKRYEVNQGMTKDPGVIESRIPNSEFEEFLRPHEREYSGFHGSNLKSSEIPLRTKEAIETFNRHIKE